MANLKEAADKKLHIVEVEVDGIKVEIDKRCKDNFDLVMTIGRVQKGEIMAIQEVMEILFGEQKERILAELREDDGFLSSEHLQNFIGEVMQAVDGKN